MYYSGHTGENVRGKNDIYVGAAISKDKKDWQKIGKVMDVYAEDPFVIYCRGSFWMFYEEKSRIPDNSISLARSEDGKHFEVFAKDIIVPKENSFQSRDTSSPVAVCLPDKVVVLYEARENDVAGATLGYAESVDFENWNQWDKPVVNFGQASFLVPQDIFYDGRRYILSFSDIISIYDNKPSNASNEADPWVSKSLKSRDLVHWVRDNYIYHSSVQAMFYNPGILYSSDSGGIYAFSQ